MARAYILLQEFDLSVRMSDTEAQTAVLRRCQATKGLTAQNYLTMAALCRQSGGGGNANAQQACLKAGLRHMSQQMPVTEFALIAQVPWQNPLKYGPQSSNPISSV